MSKGVTRFRSAGAFALHVVALGFLLVSAARGFQPSVASADTGWPMHGGPDNIRYSPLTQIHRDNVSSLRVAWTYDSRDAFKGSEMQSNPVVVDGMLYATTPTLKVIALDAATGREIWKFDPGGGAGTGGRFRHRGVTVSTGIGCSSRIAAISGRSTARRVDRFGRSDRTAGSICAKGSISRPSASR
ncbi:MAG: hypothetical protein DMG00_05995 [Acidobacteria bacterium]|nr:MAG: hypothetical protein DMG00_05995 [Acidobacteriota bacterium]